MNYQKIGDYNFTFYRDDKVRQFDIASRLPILFILNIIFTTLVDSGKTNKHLMSNKKWSC